MPPTSNKRKSYRNKSQGRQTTNSHAKNKRGLVRIIAGNHRGRRLPVMVSEGLRPTSDRVKETLFNWLMTKVSQSVCLDLFAGSGSLGIEALSRGASQVYFVEQDTKVAQSIVQNLNTLRETEKSIVLISNALTINIEALPKLDIVFIDPPFGLNLVSKSIDMLVTANKLKSGANIYIEVGHDDTFTAPASFELLKEIKTSQVNAHLYRFIG